MNKSQENNVASVFIPNSLFRMQVANMSNSTRLFAEPCWRPLIASGAKKTTRSGLSPAHWSGAAWHWALLGSLKSGELAPCRRAHSQSPATSHLGLESNTPSSQERPSGPSAAPSKKLPSKQRQLLHEKKKINTTVTASINGCENWPPSEGPNQFDLWKRSELASRFGTFTALEKGLNYTASAHYIDKILAETSYVLSSGKKCKSIWLLILQSSIAWGHVKCPKFLSSQIWGWNRSKT